MSNEDYKKVTFKEILKKEKKPQQMVSLGRISTVKPIQKKENNFLLREDGFSYLFKYARQAGEEYLISEKFFTTDRQNYSLYNFVEGASQKLVNEAFRYGLVKIIYLSKNLLEIEEFENEYTKFLAIRNF